MRLVLLLLALPIAASAQDVTPFPEPVRSGAGSLCTERDRLRVCLVDDDDAHLVASRGGTEVGRWPANGFAMSASADLRAFEVDLDADGHPETVVAHQEAVSNGLGVATWTVYVVEDEEDLFVPSYSFVARDFGPDGGSFAVWQGRPVVWATEWLESEDPSGRRGPGYYLVGRPFFLTRGGLAPVLDLPVRARRRLDGYHDRPGGPVAKLSDRRAESRRHDPYWSGAPSGQPGQIAEVADKDDGYRLVVRTEAGVHRLVVDAWSRDEQTSVRLGDGASGRIFPIEYRPAHLVGRAVRLGDGPDGTHLLWLD